MRGYRHFDVFAAHAAAYSSVNVSEEVKRGIEEEGMAALDDEDCDFLRNGLQEVMN